MKSILFIHHGSGIGGGLIALVALIEVLKHDFEITVLCIYNSEAVNYLKEKGITVEVVEGKFYSRFYDLFIHSEAGFLNAPNFIRSIKNCILYLLSMFIFSKHVLVKYKDKFDVLYLNSTFVSDWLYWGKKFFKKTVIHIREPLAKGRFGLRKKIITKIIDRYSDLIVAISKDNASRLNLLKKTVVLYDPVLKRPFNRLEFNPINKYFVYVGGSQRIKGFEDLMNCLIYLNSDIKIIFIGPIYELNESKDSISYKIRSIFSHYLRKELPRLKEIYNNSDKLIKIGTTDNVFDYYISSLSLIAPFAKPHACLPILEGMSIGKSTIISNVEGMDEFVSLLPFKKYKIGNAKDLAEQINEFSKISIVEQQVISQLYLKEYSNILDKQKKSLKLITNELNRIQ